MSIIYPTKISLIGIANSLGILLLSGSQVFKHNYYTYSYSKTSFDIEFHKHSFISMDTFRRVGILQ